MNPGAGSGTETVDVSAGRKSALASSLSADHPDGVGDTDRAYRLAQRGARRGECVRVLAEHSFRETHAAPLSSLRGSRQRVQIVSSIAGNAGSLGAARCD